MKVAPEGDSHGLSSKRLMQVFACSLLVASCASNDLAQKPPRAGNGAREYAKLATDALAEVTTTLQWLDRVDAQTNGCPPKVAERFSRQVERLQVESIRVRARGQAIQARGDAYFEAWAEMNLETNTPPQQVMEDFSQLKAAVGRIKQDSRQAGDAFRPFLAGLRKLRAQLQTDPAAFNAAGNADSIRATHDWGDQVMQRLEAIRNELQAAAPLIASVRSATKH